MLLELERRGLTDTFVVDSAATSSAHLGELPHPETRREAARHGLTLTHRARQVVSSDFERFDLILAMDRNNERELLRLAPSPAHRHKVKMFLSFLPAEERAPEEMPDPYYTGQFPEVFSLSQRAARALARPRHGERGTLIPCSLACPSLAAPSRSRSPSRSSRSLRSRPRRVRQTTPMVKALDKQEALARTPATRGPAGAPRRPRARAGAPRRLRARAGATPLAAPQGAWRRRAQAGLSGETPATKAGQAVPSARGERRRIPIRPRRQGSPRAVPSPARSCATTTCDRT